MPFELSGLQCVYTLLNDEKDVFQSVIDSHKEGTWSPCLAIFMGIYHAANVSMLTLSTCLEAGAKTVVNLTYLNIRLAIILAVTCLGCACVIPFLPLIATYHLFIVTFNVYRDPVGYSEKRITMNSNLLDQVDKTNKLARYFTSSSM